MRKAWCSTASCHALLLRWTLHTCKPVHHILYLLSAICQPSTKAASMSRDMVQVQRDELPDSNRHTLLHRMVGCNHRECKSYLKLEG